MEPKKEKIVVVGSGRSGTGYMAKLLTSGGIRCTHEGKFNPKRMIKNYTTDSSWLAVPFLDKYKDLFIVHAVRNPVGTINSFLNFNFFRKPKNRYYIFMHKHLPSLKRHKDAVDKAFHYVIAWNNLIFKYKDTDRYTLHRIEDDPVPLIELLGGNTNNLFEKTDYNTRNTSKAKNRRYNFTDNTIPKKWRPMYFELKKNMGY